MKKILAPLIGAVLLVAGTALPAQATTYRLVQVYASNSMDAAHKCVSSPIGGDHIRLTQYRDSLGRTYYWCYVPVR